MLASRHRLRTAAQFRAGTRQGARAGSAVMVVHVARTDSEASRCPRVGFVVSKAVGNAVVRNRTKRRLRALMASRLAALPAGVDVVIRANPLAASLDSSRLGLEVDTLLGRCLASARISRAARP